MTTTGDYRVGSCRPGVKRRCIPECAKVDDAQARTKE